MTILVTGGAGFIGSNLCNALIERGCALRVVDNLSTGRSNFLQGLLGRSDFEFHEADLVNYEAVLEAMHGVSAVVHLSANADVRFGWAHPRVDFLQNVTVTQNVLEAMRTLGVSRLVFSSTGSVYGQQATIPTPENAPFPIQTSLYGASKLAAEGLISAYAEAGFIKPVVFRFVSILGPRYSHGHVFDFVKQLVDDRSSLSILGNGLQRKSYLHVRDCIAALLLALENEDLRGIFNLGTEEHCSVRESVSWICDEIGVSPTLSFGSENRGWIGDNPFIFLDTQSIRKFGWHSQFSIEESIRETTQWLIKNSWILEKETNEPR